MLPPTAAAERRAARGCTLRAGVLASRRGEHVPFHSRTPSRFATAGARADRVL